MSTCLFFMNDKKQNSFKVFNYNYNTTLDTKYDTGRKPQCVSTLHETKSQHRLGKLLENNWKSCSFIAHKAQIVTFVFASVQCGLNIKWDYNLRLVL